MHRDWKNEIIDIEAKENWFDVEAKIIVRSFRSCRVEIRDNIRNLIVHTYGYCTKEDIKTALTIFKELNLEPKVKKYGKKAGKYFGSMILPIFLQNTL
jgi:hypothetical protein